MESTKINIAEYQEALNVLAKNKSDLLFSNSSPGHAAAVIETMFDNSTKSFRIYDDNLSGDLAEMRVESFYKSIENFVSRGEFLTVVVDKIESKQNTIYKTLMNLKETYPSKVKIAKSSEQFRKAITNVFKQTVNIAIGDDSSFRIEQIIDGVDAPSRKAVVSFNKEDITKPYIKAFDDNFTSCEVI